MRAYQPLPALPSYRDSCPGGKQAPVPSWSAGRVLLGQGVGGFLGCAGAFSPFPSRARSGRLPTPCPSLFFVRRVYAMAD